MMKISLDFCRHKMVVHPYYKKEKKRLKNRVSNVNLQLKIILYNSKTILDAPTRGEAK